MLKKIKNPRDLKELSEKELEELAADVRQTILKTVSKNGGHLASNLGMVEATIALHRVFDAPADKIVYDVGHQAYTHKLLTGRYESFGTLRTFGGISGFTNRWESEYDPLNEGHSGTSISAALGLAEANRLQGKKDYTIAVAGDGALTNGMIYEALNNCGDKERNLIIVINDNDMSISPNVGGLHNYLSKIRVSKSYFSFKHGFERVLSAIPLVGQSLAVFFKRVKDGLKRLFVKNNIFEDLGLIYLGPVDGNDIQKLVTVFEEAKTKHATCVVHIITKKGIGYGFAEAEPSKYHSVAPFDLLTGVQPQKTTDFSSFVGETLCRRAADDKTICAITAAMCDGTGLTGFASKFPNRFYDVGIAEEHAVTFAGGLAANGMKPVVALYSTFAQRTYDQLLHDIAIQRVPMVLMLDRCGLVPGDGITHQGVFDYPLFSSIPGITIYSPERYEELDEALTPALAGNMLSVIRYPKGAENTKDPSIPTVGNADAFLEYSENVTKADAVILTYGRVTQVARDAVKRLCGVCSVGFIKLIRIHPIPTDVLDALTKNTKLLYFLEEGIREGGVCEKIAARLTDAGGCKKIFHTVEGFVEHGSTDELFRLCGFTAETVANRIRAAMEES